MVVPVAKHITLGPQGTLLLSEAARLIRERDTSKVIDFSVERFARRLGADGSECIRVPDSKEMRMTAVRLADAAVNRSSGVLSLYYHELRSVLEAKRYRKGGKRAKVSHRIDIEKNVNHAARGEAIDYSDVEHLLKELQAESADWMERNAKHIAYSFPATPLDPRLLPQRSVYGLLKKSYLPLMCKVMSDADRMTHNAVRGVVDFLKDRETVVILSAFGALDDRYYKKFEELGHAMWVAHGIDCINSSLRHIHDELFDGDGERTAMAIMGHEVSSRELMQWILGHRLAGFNVVRMHSNLIVQQFGCAIENLLRAVTIKGLDMAQQIVEYLQKEVSVPKDDPVAEHARLTLLKKSVQAARGLYGVELSSEPWFVVEDRVSGELRELEALLLERAAGTVPPSPQPPTRRGTSTADAERAQSSGPASVTPISRGPSGSTVSMLPSVGAVAQQGAFSTFRIARGA